MSSKSRSSIFFGSPTSSSHMYVSISAIACSAVLLYSILIVKTIHDNKNKQHPDEELYDDDENQSMIKNTTNNNNNTMELLIKDTTPRNQKIRQDLLDENLVEEPWGFRNCHFASIMAAIRPSPFHFMNKNHYLVKRRLFTLPGEQNGIEVEFFEPSHIPDLEHDLKRSERPLVILLHGVSGSSKEPYMEQTALQIVANYRWRCVALNYGKIRISVQDKRKQSTKKSTASSPEAQQEDQKIILLRGGSSFMDLGDLNYLISYLRKLHHGFIGAIGFSMGGAKLVQFLTRTQKHSNLNAAVSICSPLDFTSKNVTVYSNKFIHRIYHFFLTLSLKVWILKNLDILKQHPSIKTKDPFKSFKWWIQTNRVTDFDNAITLPGKGYTNIEDYYKDASRHCKHLEKIKIPFLYICALNDPFTPLDIIPGLKEVNQNENLVVIKTQYGGHIGYWFPGKGCWATDCSVQFFKSIIHHHQHNNVQHAQQDGKKKKKTENIQKTNSKKKENERNRRDSIISFSSSNKRRRNSRYYFSQTSFKAARNLQKTSTTALTDYYKLIVPDSSINMAQMA